MVGAAEAALGPLGILVTSAGIAPVAPHTELDFAGLAPGHGDQPRRHVSVDHGGA